MRFVNLFLKRSIDILGSGIGLIVILPLLIIIALLIKITSPGPVFFFQERLGRNGKVFRIIKFRTMVVNAEKLGDGLRVKDDSDLRITKIGKFLRATSLDELPQLFNVVKGEMSLVGPRPPVPYHPYKYEEYTEEQRRRFTMRPGITGLAQVRGRGSISWESKIIIDIEYILKFNILLDIKIMLLTMKKLFQGNDIYLN
jgi:undecaprenyl phosphate N,N'-diacetylbacillosamine 1-phosphate transferase